MHGLFKAADALVATDKRKNARPRRNRAVMAMLRFTGLRVSELCALRLDQLDGKHLDRVVRKGGGRDRVFLNSECRRLLADYIAHERGEGDALFLSTRGGHLSRHAAADLLQRITDAANDHRPTDRQIAIHPHRLRHMFGADVRTRTGSDGETAALLGHRSTQYVARYARETTLRSSATAERELVLEGTRG